MNTEDNRRDLFKKINNIKQLKDFIKEISLSKNYVRVIKEIDRKGTNKFVEDIFGDFLIKKIMNLGLNTGEIRKEDYQEIKEFMQVFADLDNALNIYGKRDFLQNQASRGNISPKVRSSLNGEIEELSYFRKEIAGIVGGKQIEKELKEFILSSKAFKGVNKREKSRNAEYIFEEMFSDMKANIAAEELGAIKTYIDSKKFNEDMRRGAHKRVKNLNAILRKREKEIKKIDPVKNKEEFSKIERVIKMAKRELTEEESVRDLVDAIADVNESRDKRIAKIYAALKNRVNKITMYLKVEKRDGKYQAKEFNTENSNGIAGSGFVDVAMLVDKKMHINVITSDPTTQVENSQVFRHLEGIKNFLYNEGYNDIEIVPTFTSPSIVSEEKSRKNNFLKGGNFSTRYLLDDNSIKEDILKKINSLPLLTSLKYVTKKSGFKTEDLLNYNYETYGGKNNWDDIKTKEDAFKTIMDSLDFFSSYNGGLINNSSSAHNIVKVLDNIGQVLTTNFNEELYASDRSIGILKNFEKNFNQKLDPQMVSFTTLTKMLEMESINKRLMEEIEKRNNINVAKPKL